ncbi:MAG: flippase-like domain-containing protein [Chloroflexi bacterium]|nr:flippase-like domain-containing protein [Chloroflexota bacterium]
MKRTLSGVGQIAVGLAASGGLGWLALHGLDWGLVRDELARVSIPFVVLAVVVFMAASYLRAYRWQLLFISEKISTARLFVIQNEGIGLNNMVPVRVASEPTQLAVLTLRDRISGATALATLGMERVIDVIASTMILAVAFFLVPEMENFALYVWGAVGFTVVAVALVFVLGWGSMAVALFRRIAFFIAFAKAIRDLVAHRGRLSVALLASVGYWVLVGVTAWIIALAIDLDISLTTATLVIMGTIFFATAVPSAPSAIGTFEFAVIYVLEFFGVEREAGFGFAVLTHAVLFLPPTVIAAVFLPREGIGSVQRLTGLVWRGVGAGNSTST